jgi:hypothetical protein
LAVNVIELIEISTLNSYLGIKAKQCIFLAEVDIKFFRGLHEPQSKRHQWKNYKFYLFQINKFINPTPVYYEIIIMPILNTGVPDMHGKILTTRYWLHVELGKNIKKNSMSKKR